MAFTRKQRVLLAVIPPLVAALIRVLGSTLRFYNVAEPGVQIGDTIAPPITFAFWHRSLLLAAWRFRGLNIGILISQSFDGEIIARITQLLGFTPVRGSSSRGGAAGLLAMETQVRTGHRTAFTADGPRGPIYVAKPGFTHLAQSTTGDAGCFHLEPHSAWTLKSWDRFLIPKPFTRVAVSWPQHVLIAKDEDFDVAHSRVQTMMTRAVTMAEEAVKANKRA